MKKNFKYPEFTVFEPDCCDVITTSGGLVEDTAHDDGYGGFIDLDSLGL